MNIKVWDDKYSIKSDPYCYKVSEICTKINNDEETLDTVKSDDGTYEKTLGYVNNIAQCFRLIVDHEGRTNKCSTVEGYIKHLEKINKKLEDNIAMFVDIVDSEKMVERAMKRHKLEE